MGNFFGALLSGYANIALQKEQLQQSREDAQKKLAVTTLGSILDNPQTTDEGREWAMGQIEEQLDIKSKRGEMSPLRAVLTKLRGKVPQSQRYQPPTPFGQAPQAQATAEARQSREEPLPMRQPGGKEIAPQGTRTAPAVPRLTMTQDEARNAALSTWRAQEEATHRDKMEEIAASRAAAPKTSDQMWYDAIEREKGRPPTSEEVTAHYVNERMKPTDQLLAMADEADAAGQGDIAKALRDRAKADYAAKKPPPNPTLFSLVRSANQGDPQAVKDLNTYFSLQKDLAKARGEGYGAGRAIYQLNPYVMPDGSISVLSNMDVIMRQRNGEQFTPAGRLSATQITAAQRMISEANPALTEAGRYVGTFDNTGDKAIFARLLQTPGNTPGAEEGWLHNMLNQQLAGQLSPEGRNELVRLTRLADSVGTLRQAVGAPATNQMMGMITALIPGPSTPDSAMARDRLEQLKQMIDNAVQIPALKPATGGGGGASTGKFTRQKGGVYVEQ